MYQEKYQNFSPFQKELISNIFKNKYHHEYSMEFKQCCYMNSCEYLAIDVIEDRWWFLQYVWANRNKIQVEFISLNCRLSTIVNKTN